MSYGTDSNVLVAIYIKKLPHIHVDCFVTHKTRIIKKKTFTSVTVCKKFSEQGRDLLEVSYMERGVIKIHEINQRCFFSGSNFSFKPIYVS